MISGDNRRMSQGDDSLTRHIFLVITEGAFSSVNFLLLYEFPIIIYLTKTLL